MKDSLPAEANVKISKSPQTCWAKLNQISLSLPTGRKLAVLFNFGGRWRSEHCFWGEFRRRGRTKSKDGIISFERAPKTTVVLKEHWKNQPFYNWTFLQYPCKIGVPRYYNFWFIWTYFSYSCTPSERVDTVSRSYKQKNTTWFIACRTFAYFIFPYLTPLKPFSLTLSLQPPLPSATYFIPGIYQKAYKWFQQGCGCVVDTMVRWGNVAVITTIAIITRHLCTHLCTRGFSPLFTAR